jgi:predicted amidohydrolase YtcJ
VRSKISLVLLALVVVALALPATAAAGKIRPADTVFKGGYVYTVNATSTVASAVAVRDGKIVYVGSDAGVAAYVGQTTKVVQLGGRMMLPSFIDSHTHTIMTVSGLYSALLYYLPSVDAYVQAVADFAATHTGPDFPWIPGQGWSNTVVPDIGPLATDLDRGVSDRPSAIMSEDGHSYWCNSKALAAAGITGKTPNPANGVIERLPNSVDAQDPFGVPSGTVREAANYLVTNIIPDYTVAQYEDGLRYYQQETAAPLGITTVFDPLLRMSRPNAIEAYQDMAATGQLTVRVRAALEVKPTDDLTTWIAAAQAERAKHTTPMFQTPAVKVFADGVVEGHTAYLDDPYADALAYAGDATYRGWPLWTPDAMRKAFVAFDKAGFQIHTHSIGDAATTEVLDALAYTRKVNKAHDWRPGITHLQLVNTPDFKRFASLGVTAVPDPYWFIKDDYYTNLQVPYLGLPRADYEYPMKSFFDNGVLVASASDYPVTLPPAPLTGIAVGVTRWDPTWVYRYPAWPDPSGMLWPAEAVTVDRMIRSFTINGAKANFLENTTGSIEVGKSADLIVLDTNLFNVSPDKIFGAKVIYTMGQGKVLYNGPGPGGSPMF